MTWLILPVVGCSNAQPTEAASSSTAEALGEMGCAYESTTQLPSNSPFSSYDYAHVLTIPSSAPSGVVSLTTTFGALAVPPDDKCPGQHVIELDGWPNAFKYGFGQLELVVQTDVGRMKDPCNTVKYSVGVYQRKNGVWSYVPDKSFSGTAVPWEGMCSMNTPGMPSALTVESVPGDGSDAVRFAVAFNQDTTGSKGTPGSVPLGFSAFYTLYPRP